MKEDNWNTESIDDLSGKIAIVTGSNTGLGKETAKQLAAKNATVIIAVRNIDKGQQAASEIKRQFSKADIDVMELNLASLKSVRSFAKDFSKKYKKLDFLINNAGVMMPPYSKTEDGYELQFGTNHLGHFALSGLLLPMLRATKNSRIVTVSSGAHNWGNLDFDDLNWEKRDYKPQRAYGDSKIANLYFTYELSRRLKDTDIKVVAAHPGWTATDLQRNSRLFSVLNPFFAQKPHMGALPTLRAATDSKVKSGDYYGPKGKREIKGYPVKVQSNELSKDMQIAKKLWDVSEHLTDVKYKF